ncbi:hypothetical protein [Treponema sp. R8-4-B8]
MEIIGLIDSINKSVISIDFGRKGFAIEGKEREGRINYEDGIAKALSTFQQAQTAADPHTIILAEYTFLSQELVFLDKSDKESISSLTRAIRFFDDAFLALEVIGDKPLYQCAEKIIPHDSKYRVKGFPKDSFHIACSGHKARIQNILKTPGLDPIEKALLKQRLINMSTAQTAYTEKQKEALAK